MLHKNSLLLNKAFIAWILAKIISVLAIGSGYLGFRYLGLPLFGVAGLLLIFAIYNCIKNMQFDKNREIRI